MGVVLEDGSRVGVIGGGPAGSLFTYSLLTFAEPADLRVDIETEEPREDVGVLPFPARLAGKEIFLAELSAGEFFGEMSVFERGPRAELPDMPCWSAGRPSPGSSGPRSRRCPRALPRIRPPAPGSSPRKDAPLATLQRERTPRPPPICAASVRRDRLTIYQTRDALEASAAAGGQTEAP
jgi:hypothetical protein